jgi:hypothetical protein
MTALGRLTWLEAKLLAREPFALIFTLGFPLVLLVVLPARRPVLRHGRPVGLLPGQLRRRGHRGAGPRGAARPHRGLPRARGLQVLRQAREAAAGAEDDFRGALPPADRRRLKELLRAVVHQ